AGNNLERGVGRAERRVAFMVVVMGLTFLTAWTPYAVISLIMAFGDHNYVTPGAAAVPAIFAKSSCMYNPIIYVGLNTQFRSAWSRLLCCQEEGPLGTVTGVNTEKMSLTVFTDQSPHIHPDVAKTRRFARGRATSGASSAFRTMSPDTNSLKVMQLNPNRVQKDVQVSADTSGRVSSEIV
ncbi:unnamed protein product, partial [Meganyctiphanes norvegica]